MMDDCMACELTDGRRRLPGGRIFGTDRWVVEHCVGPLGLGTLIVKPRRHVTRVASLTVEEAAQLGTLLRRTSAVAEQLVSAEQTYNCLWSHAGGIAGHIHFVVQPVTAAQVAEFDSHGPGLQLAMFSHGEAPQESEIETVAERARQAFS